MKRRKLWGTVKVIIKPVPAEAGMMAGQLAAHPALEPLSGFVMLAGRAVAIATRLIGDVALSALLALKVGKARLLSAALHDGIDDFAVLARHLIPEVLDVLGTEGAEGLSPHALSGDLSYRRHSRTPSWSG
jgi:hypothetical protein